MPLDIQALTPDLEEAYFDFFDHLFPSFLISHLYIACLLWYTHRRDAICPAGQCSSISV